VNKNEIRKILKQRKSKQRDEMESTTTTPTKKVLPPEIINLASTSRIQGVPFKAQQNDKSIPKLQAISTL
jgi:hypothetical protein